jgi:hypothetical protein
VPASGRPDETDVTQSAVLAHEQDHLLRLLSTSYGYLRYVLDVAMTFFFVETAQQALAAGRHPVFPLIQSFPGGLTAFPRPYQLEPLRVLPLRADGHFRSLCHLLAFEEFQRSMDGVDALFDPQMALFGARLFDGFARGRSVLPTTLERATLSTFLARFYSPGNLAVPRHQGGALGAFLLLECLGYLMEVQISSAQGGNGETLERKLRSARYSTVYRLFRDSVLQEHPYSGPGLPVEFEAAVELSLWIPWGPQGALCAANWPDIQPGWRFLRILEHLAEQKPPWTSPAVADFDAIDTAMLAVQERFCARMGWPTPAEIIDAWLAQEDEAMPLPLLYAGHPRRRMLRDGLQWRKTSPFRLYLNDARILENPMGPSFPGFVCEDTDLTLESATWRNAHGQAMNWVDLNCFKGFRAFHHGLGVHLDLMARHMPAMVRTLTAVAATDKDYDADVIASLLRDHAEKECGGIEWA